MDPHGSPTTQDSIVQPQHLVHMYSANQRSALPPTWRDMWARFAGGARARPIGGHRARSERGEWPGRIVAALSLHCSTVAPRMCRAKNRRRHRLWLEPTAVTPCVSRYNARAWTQSMAARVLLYRRGCGTSVMQCGRAPPCASQSRRPPSTGSLRVRWLAPPPAAPPNLRAPQASCG